jgi:hypothetical protein
MYRFSPLVFIQAAVFVFFATSAVAGIVSSDLPFF